MRLTEADVLLLLDWLYRPTPILAPIPVEIAHLPEVADRVAYYVGTAGKRIGSQPVRKSLEKLLHDPIVRMSALEGLDAFGDRKSVAAIRTVSKDPDPSFVRQAAIVLGSLGGAEAIQVLQLMLVNWSRDTVVGKTIVGALEEAGDVTS